MKLSARFDYEQVDHEKNNTVRLLVTVEAPNIDWVTQRPQICILPVIDISYSMDGPKFTYARQACRKLIEQLKPGDYAGLVTFARDVKVVVAPQPVTQELKAQLVRELERLRPNGGTNFSEAVTQALASLERLDLPSTTLHRAIFFTDGEPTCGVTDRAMIKSLLAKNLHSFSMSFFGYGDALGRGCDQEFLTELSDVGRGNYAYVQNPDDALAAFGRELGGLLSTYASDLRVVLEPRNGHSIDKVITRLEGVSDAGSSDLTEVALDLGDLLAEEHRHLVVECTVNKQDKPLPRDFSIINVKATCRRVTREGGKETEEASTAAKIRFVRPGEAQGTPTPEVGAIVALHQLALAQHQAESQAAAGRYAAAGDVLRSFSLEAQSKGYGAVAGVATNLQAHMANPAAYRASQGYRKSVGRGLTHSSRLASYDSAAQADLSAVSGRIGTNAQAVYGDLFKRSEASAVDVAPPEAPLLTPIGQWYTVPAAVAPPAPVVLPVDPDEGETAR